MLRLVGRMADGWLPSLSRLDGPQRDRGRQRRDRRVGARQQGASPAEIRRLLNLRPEGRDARVPDRAGPRARGLRVHPRHRRPGRDRALRAGGRPRGPRARRGAAPRGGAGADGGDGSRRAAARPQAQASGWRRPSLPAYGSVPVCRGTRTRGRAAPASGEGGYTDRGRQVSQHLVDVHDALRAELDGVRDIVEQVVAGARDIGGARSAINAMSLRQNDWTLGGYCQAYCRIVTQHHTLEDEGIFPHLRRSRPRAGAGGRPAGGGAPRHPRRARGRRPGAGRASWPARASTRSCARRSTS